MPNPKTVRFFLGANSAAGFYSLYDWLIPLNTARDIIILKGGPGCGKSSFMKRIAGRLAEYGVAGEEILCASDSQSLDGVIFSSIGTAIADGTSPHVLEPRYPGAVDRYINLGSFYNVDALKKERERIVFLTDAYKEGYSKVYRFLSAAKSLLDEAFNIVLAGASIDKIAKRARGVISREITGEKGTGVMAKRFLSAIAPAGVLYQFDTVNALCEKVYQITDTYGLSHFFLSPILNAAIESGLKAVACYCPINPQKLEHVLIPELSLAFVTTGDYAAYPYETFRTVRLDPGIDHETVRKNRHRLRFCRKTARVLIEQASEDLRRIKELHDELEAVYNPNMDFDAMYKLAERTADEIIAAAGLRQE